MSSDLTMLFRGAPGVERAREIIDRMGQQQIPTSPANYEIWTTHIAGVKPDLSREIEARLERGEQFTDETNEELFERFFANTRLSIQMLETSETIARELDDTVSNLRGAGDRRVLTPRCCRMRRRASRAAWTQPNFARSWIIWRTRRTR